MKEKLEIITKRTAVGLSVFNAMAFYAMRPCWSGISKTLGYETSGSWLILNLPPLLFLLMLGCAAAAVVLSLAAKKGRRWGCVLSAAGVVFLGAILAVYFLGAVDYARFILFHFANEAGILAAVLLGAFLLFRYPGSKWKDSRLFRYGLLALLLVCGAVAFFGIQINFITYEPVVYAVEEEYQIVFSGSAKAMGWVEIGGTVYSDTYAGSLRSSERVHKISVPQEVLDRAGEYTVYTQAYLYRGPFGAIKGSAVSRSYRFTPVDLSDGLQYYALSDIHMDTAGAEKSMEGLEGVELLILNGDMISDVENFYDANYVNKVAFSLTGGGIPVIYARGNHEVKGAWSDRLFRFVGSKDETFYYTVTMGGLYCVVLDLGEDHDEGWWEYYGSDDFDRYRSEQLDFLRAEAAREDLADFDYRLAVCHIPLPFINSRRDHVSIKTELVEVLNGMDIDMCLAGHQHDLFIFEPGAVQCDPTETAPLTWNREYYADRQYKGYLLDFEFPTLMVSKSGLTQTDGDRKNAMIGLSVTVDLDAGVQTCFYRNARGERVPVVNPFAEIRYGDLFTIRLDTGAFSHEEG